MPHRFSRKLNVLKTIGLMRFEEAYAAVARDSSSYFLISKVVSRRSVL